jgi:acetyltransferase-like isoleucine patch superfamily enzyme
MRKITPAQILCFSALVTVVGLLAVGTTWALMGSVPLGDFRGVALTGAAVLFFYGYAFLMYRLFLSAMPLPHGLVVPGTRGEFSAQVNILFYLLLFNTLIRTHFLPVPLLRLVYLALGARLGSNTYSAGALLDPPLTTIGANSIVGHDAALFAHAIEGDRFSLSPIVIGDDVTIGATAVVMSGVTIGDGAIVSAGAVVGKDTRIGPREIWGGVPARLLKRRPDGEAA